MQKSVKEFVEKHDLSCGAQGRYIDLVSEVGELGKEILKSTDYGKEPYRPSEAAADEMGDCLFSLLALCCELGVDAEKALEYALKKYGKRFDKSGTIGSGR